MSTALIGAYEAQTHLPRVLRDMQLASAAASAGVPPIK